MSGLLDAPLVGESPAVPPHGAAGDRVLVLGVGNVLMGDEGVGIHVVRELERGAPRPGVRLLDGGTGGISLLVEFEGVEDVVLVDATRDGQPAGAITYLQPGKVGELPRGLGAHDFGLKDLFAAAALVGRLPRLHLFTISVEEITPMCTALTPAVHEAARRVARAIPGFAAGLARWEG